MIVDKGQVEIPGIEAAVPLAVIGFLLAMEDFLTMDIYNLGVCH